MDKSPEAFRTISEVAESLDVPPHVLRFWETRFAQVKPVKRGGGRRYYRPEDVQLLRGIRGLLYGDGMTIKGVQKILRERGVRHVIGLGSAEAEAVRAEAKAREPERTGSVASEALPEPTPADAFELAEEETPFEHRSPAILSEPADLRSLRDLVRALEALRVVMAEDIAP